MSRMTSVLAAVTVLALAAACAGSGVASYRGVPEMNGVRTADAGRQLVVTYIGGGCDEQAKTRVIETATLVTVTAAIPTTGGNCTSVGIARELTFRLQRPLGDRHFRNGLRGRAITVFDGSLLRTPGWLPSGAQPPPSGGTLPYPRSRSNGPIPPVTSPVS
jgi:hypothetical protein